MLRCRGKERRRLSSRATVGHNGGSSTGKNHAMGCNSQKIRDLRRQIPSFECVPGCHDCCGPVTTSSEEMARLPRKTAAEQDAALEALNCVHLGPDGCTVYEERPLICRLFGTTERLPCPNGRRPETLIHPRVENQVHEFIASTRQVLV